MWCHDLNEKDGGGFQLPIDDIAVFPQIRQDETTEETIRIVEGAPSLFGVLTEPVCSDKEDGPIVLMVNTGLAHNIGGGRVLDQLTEHLSTNGVRSFRIDLSYIGDSVDSLNDSDVNPYSSKAIVDIGNAVRFIVDNYSSASISILGICAGAHNAFKYAASDNAVPVDRIFLLNPDSFDFKEGEDVLSPLHTVKAMSKSMIGKNIDNYKVDVLKYGALRRIKLTVILGLKVFKHVLGRVGDEAYFRRLNSRKMVSALRLIERRDTAISVHCCNEASSYSIIQYYAADEFSRMLENKTASIHTYNKAGHTFGDLSSRRLLFDNLLSEIVSDNSKS